MRTTPARARPARARSPSRGRRPSTGRRRGDRDDDAAAARRRARRARRRVPRARAAASCAGRVGAALADVARLARRAPPPTLRRSRPARRRRPGSSRGGRRRARAARPAGRRRRGSGRRARRAARVRWSHGRAEAVEEVADALVRARRDGGRRRHDRDAAAACGARAAARTRRRPRRVRGRTVLPRARAPPRHELPRASVSEGLEAAGTVPRAMPIYEYKCPNGHHIEVFHGMSEPGPRSARSAAPRRWSACCIPVAVHYKGSGFYSTDYGRAGGRLRRRTAAPASRPRGGGDSSSGGGDSGGSGGRARQQLGRARRARLVGLVRLLGVRLGRLTATAAGARCGSRARTSSSAAAAPMRPPTSRARCGCPPTARSPRSRRRVVASPPRRQ